jgi:hypothetical protein
MAARHDELAFQATVVPDSEHVFSFKPVIAGTDGSPPSQPLALLLNPGNGAGALRSGPGRGFAYPIAFMETWPNGAYLRPKRD